LSFHLYLSGELRVDELARELETLFPDPLVCFGILKLQLLVVYLYRLGVLYQIYYAKALWEGN
jgi:hypothetical protein